MKPEFVKYLSQDSIIVLDGKTKRDVLEEIVSFASTKCTIEISQIRDAVWKREKMMTTGVGQGLALPHIRIPGFGAPLVIIGVTRKPITDYKSLDDEPIRVIVFIAAQEDNQEAYLKLLGSVSYKLKDSGIIEKILENIDAPDKIHKLLAK